MSKLISEEIVEAITLGDKEGFMSAFHSALAAKVSDALEIKKVEIASTLIAPASSEVVEEEVELDESRAAEKLMDRLDFDSDSYHENNLKHIAIAPTAHLKYLLKYNMGRSGGGDHPMIPHIKKELEKRSMKKEEVEQIDEATPPIYPVHHIPTGKRVGTFQAGKGFTPHPNSNLKPGEIPNYHAKGKEPINMGSDRKMKVEEVEQIDEWRHSENERHKKRMAKGMSPEESYAKMKKTRDNEENARREKRATAKLAKEEVESIEEGTPEAKRQSRAAWRMDTAEVIAKNHAKIAAKKKAAQKKLLSGKGK